MSRPLHRGPSFGERVREGVASAGRVLLGCLGLVLVFALGGGALSGFLGGGAAPTGSADAIAYPTDEWTFAPEPTVEPTAERVRVTLAEALEDRLVKLTATGRNLEQLAIDLESLVEDALQVVIEPGTVFSPGAKSTQPMVVIDTVTIDLDPGDVISDLIDVACDSMRLDTPDSKDTFRLDAARSTTNLRKLVTAPSFVAATFRLKQFAIWTLTDNPTKTGFVGLGTGGTGSGPTTKELAAIKAMFKEAGIDPAKYRALR
jgi:hypothetical protein